MSEEIVSEITRDYIHKLVSEGKRADGRSFNDYREIKIAKNVIMTAEGSAQVNLGDTTVVVAVKMEVGEPFPDTPNAGVLTTNAELIPMASPTFEPGPPSEDAIELARVIDRGIRESRAIELEKLCIVPKEKVWIVFVDIHVLDYDGNLFDAAALGALAALSTTRVPAKQFELGEDYMLSVVRQPVACTIVKIGKSLLVDPSLDEEKIATARLTITTDEDGNIRAMQKGLSGGLTYDDIISAVGLAHELAPKLRDKIFASQKFYKNYSPT